MRRGFSISASAFGAFRHSLVTPRAWPTEPHKQVVQFCGIDAWEPNQELNEECCPALCSLFLRNRLGQLRVKRARWIRHTCSLGFTPSARHAEPLRRRPSQRSSRIPLRLATDPNNSSQSPQIKDRPGTLCTKCERTGLAEGNIDAGAG